MKVQEAVFPALSVAIHVTVVKPDGGVQTISGEESKSSPAEMDKKNDASLPEISNFGVGQIM